MSDLLFPMLKSSIGASLLYLFYLVAVKKKATSAFNRFYLLFIIVFTVYVPFINISFLSDFLGSLNGPQTGIQFQHNPVSEDSSNEINPLSIISGLYFLGISFFVLRFSFSLGSLLTLSRKAKKCLINGKRVLVTPKAKPAFSFFGMIYISPETLSNAECLPLILEHEHAHKSHWHSLDILLINLYCIVFWFNPFSHLIKKEMVRGIEHQADYQVCKRHNKKSYIQTLLSYQTDSKFSLATQFAHHPIRDRINQIATAGGTKKTNWLSIGLLIPMLLFISCLLGGHTSSIGKTLGTYEASENCDCEYIHITNDNKVIVEKRGKYGAIQTLDDMPKD